jgi:hypothetical protein
MPKKSPTIKPQHFRMRLPIYDTVVVHLVLTPDPYQYCQSRRIVDCTEAEFGRGRAFTVVKDSQIYVLLRIPGGVNRRSLVHELKHVGSSVMDIAGIKIDGENDEPEAYLIDWVYGWMEGCMERSKTPWGIYSSIWT